MNLYQINAEIEALENAVEDGILIHPETGELMTFKEALSELKMERTGKMENLALLCKKLSTHIDQIDNEISRLENIKKQKLKRLEKRKNDLEYFMRMADGRTLPFYGTKVTVFVRENSPSVVISDENKLPREFMIQKITMAADKASLKEALSRGIEVPGARLEQKRSVIIK